MSLRVALQRAEGAAPTRGTREPEWREVSEPFRRLFPIHRQIRSVLLRVRQQVVEAIEFTSGVRQACGMSHHALKASGCAFVEHGQSLDRSNPIVRPASDHEVSATLGVDPRSRPAFRTGSALHGSSVGSNTPGSTPPGAATIQRRRSLRRCWPAVRRPLSDRRRPAPRAIQRSAPRRTARRRQRE